MRLLSSLAGEFVPIGIHALFPNASLQVARSKKRQRTGGVQNFEGVADGLGVSLYCCVGEGLRT